MAVKKIDYMENARYWGMTLVGNELRLVDKPVSYTNNLPVKTRDKIKACSTIGLTYWADHPGKACVWATDFHRRWHVVKIDYKNREVEHYCGKSDALGHVHGSTKCVETGRREGFFACENLQIAALELAIPTLDDMEQHRVLSDIWHSTPVFFNPLDWGPNHTISETKVRKTRLEAKTALRDAEMDKLTSTATAAVRADYAKADAKTAARTMPKRAPAPTKPAPTVVGMTLDAAIKLINFDPDYLDDVPTHRLREALGATPHDDKINTELTRREQTPEQEAS